MRTEEIKEVEGESYQDLKNIARIFYLLTYKDFDVLCAVTGPKGVGKSSLAIQLSREILKLQGKEFDPDRHVAYLYEDVIDKIGQLEEHEPLIIDEAVNVMMSEDWNKVESKYLKKVFAKLRVRHLVVFLCIPDFNWLDKKYREGMVNFWFIVPARGVFFLLSPKPFSDDIWGMKKLSKILGKLNYIDILNGEMILRSEITELLRSTGMVLGYGPFSKVPQDIYEKYLELRKQAIEKSSEQGEVLKIEASKIPLLIKIYEMKNLGINDKEIAKQLGISESAVRKYKKFLNA